MIYGITGGIGAGKSAVTNYLKSKGCRVLDADEISREVESKDAPLLRILVKDFGIDIIREDGELDRRLLAERAFSSQENTRRLNDLVQTAVLVRALEKIHRMGVKYSDDIVFFDVPMLFEAGWDKYCDQVWVVTAPEETRIERFVARDGLTFAEIRQRMRLQMSDEEKIQRADAVINNSSDYDSLYRQIDQLLSGLCESEDK